MSVTHSIPVSTALKDTTTSFSPSGDRSPTAACSQAHSRSPPQSQFTSCKEGEEDEAKVPGAPDHHRTYSINSTSDDDRTRQSSDTSNQGSTLKGKHNNQNDEIDREPSPIVPISPSPPPITLRLRALPQSSQQALRNPNQQHQGRPHATTATTLATTTTSKRQTSAKSAGTLMPIHPSVDNVLKSPSSKSQSQSGSPRSPTHHDPFIVNSENRNISPSSEAESRHSIPLASRSESGTTSGLPISTPNSRISTPAMSTRRSSSAVVGLGLGLGLDGAGMESDSSLDQNRNQNHYQGPKGKSRVQPKRGSPSKPTPPQQTAVAAAATPNMANNENDNPLGSGSGSGSGPNASTVKSASKSASGPTSTSGSVSASASATPSRRSSVQSQHQNVNQKGWAEGMDYVYEYVQVSQRREGRKNISYEMTMRQQPKQARMCGVGEKSDRRPVDPTPIIQLKVIDGNGDDVTDLDPRMRDSGDSSNNLRRPSPGPGGMTFMQNPHYFLFACLVGGDEEEDELHVIDDGRTRFLTGTPVSSLYHLKDVDNTDAAFFVFPDLGVRKEGRYKLKLTLFEIVEQEVFYCTTMYTATFSVYSAKKFPGMEKATDLSRSFADQGLKIRVRKEPRPSSKNSKIKRKSDQGSEEEEGLQIKKSRTHSFPQYQAPTSHPYALGTGHPGDDYRPGPGPGPSPSSARPGSGLDSQSHAYGISPMGYYQYPPNHGAALTHSHPHAQVQAHGSASSSYQPSFIANQQQQHHHHMAPPPVPGGDPRDAYRQYTGYQPHPYHVPPASSQHHDQHAQAQMQTQSQSQLQPHSQPGPPSRPNSTSAHSSGSSTSHSLSHSGTQRGNGSGPSGPPPHARSRHAQHQSHSHRASVPVPPPGYLPEHGQSHLAQAPSHTHTSFNAYPSNIEHPHIREGPPPSASYYDRQQRSRPGSASGGVPWPQQSLQQSQSGPNTARINSRPGSGSGSGSRSGPPPLTPTPGSHRYRSPPRSATPVMASYNKNQSIHPLVPLHSQSQHYANYSPTDASRSPASSLPPTATSITTFNNQGRDSISSSSSSSSPLRLAPINSLLAHNQSSSSLAFVAHPSPNLDGTGVASTATGTRRDDDDPDATSIVSGGVSSDTASPALALTPTGGGGGGNTELKYDDDQVVKKVTGRMGLGHLMD